MQKIQRAINSAMALANANGVSQPEHVDAIIGAMTRKVVDGLTDEAIYETGRLLAKELAYREAQLTVIQLIERVTQHGSPLAARQALS